jgi:hypothetical protein
MAYDEELAKTILSSAADHFPEPISNFEELQLLTKVQRRNWDPDWRLAIEGLIAEQKIELQKALRTGVGQNLQGFINLRITRSGKRFLNRSA